MCQQGLQVRCKQTHCNGQEDNAKELAHQVNGALGYDSFNLVGGFEYDKDEYHIDEQTNHDVGGGILGAKRKQGGE